MTNHQSQGGPTTELGVVINKNRHKASEKVMMRNKVSGNGEVSGNGKRLVMRKCLIMGNCLVMWKCLAMGKCLMNKILGERCKSKYSS